MGLVSVVGESESVWFVGESFEEGRVTLGSVIVCYSTVGWIEDMNALLACGLSFLVFLLGQQCYL